MSELVYYSPQHEGIILNEEGMNLQSLTRSTSFRRENSSSSLGKQQQQHQQSSSCSSSTLLTYNSSMTSDASSCARLSPPNSFHNGLRRSTFDLSDYQQQHRKSSNGSLRYRGAGSREGCCGDEATKALSQLGSFSSFTSSSSSYAETETSSVYTAPTAAAQRKRSDDDNHHDDLFHFMGLEVIIEDVMLGYMAILMLGVNMYHRLERLLLDLKHVGEVSWDWLSNLYQFEEPLERRTSSVVADDSFRGQQQQQSHCTSLNDSLAAMHESDSTEDLLTPLKLVTPPPTESEEVAARDEWGHFADFQEELADEKSFIPSCSRVSSTISRRGGTTLKKASTSGLATLAEVREEERDDEEEEEEDWSF